MSCFGQSIRSKRDKRLFEFPRDKFPFTLMLCRLRDALPRTISSAFCWHRHIIVTLLLIRIKEKETENLQKNQNIPIFYTNSIQTCRGFAARSTYLCVGFACRKRVTLTMWCASYVCMKLWSMNDNDVSECEWEFAQNTCTVYTHSHLSNFKSLILLFASIFNTRNSGGRTSATWHILPIFFSLCLGRRNRIVPGYGFVVSDRREKDVQ